MPVLWARVQERKLDLLCGLPRSSSQRTLESKVMAHSDQEGDTFLVCEGF